MHNHDDQTRTGFVAGLAAFLAWGLLPVYWKAVQSVPAVEILCHRIVWSAVFTGIVLTLQRRWQETCRALHRGANRRFLLLSGTLVALNWGVYIWAVNSGHVVQASLGYYINPLVNVILGYLFFGDRPRPLQKLAILFAALGVLNLLVSFGKLPWISLVLAFSFGFYGLVRKKMEIEPLPGLFIETTALAIPAGGYLAWHAWQGTGALGQSGMAVNLLLLGAGAATSLPLWSFTIAARKLSLVTVGILQYLAPTCMFLLGVFAYGEPFTTVHLITFILIWVGVLLYTMEGILLMRKTPQRTSS